MKLSTKTAAVRAIPYDVTPQGETVGEIVAQRVGAILATLHTQQRKGDAILNMAVRVVASMAALKRAQMRLERALYEDDLTNHEEDVLTNHEEDILS